jgi:hypothetical protein
MQDLTSRIMARVSEQIRLLDSSLITGKGVSNMERYQRLLGEREGLQTCLNIIDDILTENDEAE